MRHVREAIGEEEEEEAEISQFQRLPDDIVLNIFDKVSNIKWLCRCSMVSKRFSSLVPLVQTVSTRISMPLSKPGNNGLCAKFLKFLFNTVLKPLRHFHELAFSPTLQSNDLRRLVFLSSLKQTRFLNFEFVSDYSAINDSVFQWGAQFNTKQGSVTFLFAKSLSKIREPEEGLEEEELRRHSYSAMWVELWIYALCNVVPQHPMLQSITISDSINKGVPKGYLGGEKLVECRNAVTLADASWAKQDVRVGYVPVLQLPRSGYLMKGATIMNCKMYSDDDYEVDSAVLDAFAEEEGVFLEAVEQILEHHRECIKPRFANQN